MSARRVARSCRSRPARPHRPVAHPAGCLLRRAATGVTALLGRNGVGKTTTLHAILGLVGRAAARSSSTATSDRALPTHRIVRRGVGYVPEDREVFAELTVAENLRLAERDATRATTSSTSSSRSCASAARSGPARCPAASSRWSRSPGRC